MTDTLATPKAAIPTVGKTVAPGFFLASVVYGYLALKSGSILPGMALHVAGDLAFAYFALLGGDSARLFAR